jgi:hypothetical protein
LILGTLGLKLAVFEDEEALRKVSGRFTKRRHTSRTVSTPVSIHHRPGTFTSEVARLMAAIRVAKIPHKRRSQIARKAARTRWAKQNHQAVAAVSGR